MNDALVKRLEKMDNKKSENEVNPKKVISLVQKYEGKFNEMDSKLKDEKKNLMINLNKKEKNLKNLFENTNLNFNEIKSEVKNLNEKLIEMEEKQKEKEEALKTGFEGDNLTVENNLYVNGVTFSKKLITKQINFDSIGIKNNVMKVNDKTKLVIGDESFDFSEVFKLLTYVQNIQKLCGENLQFCKLVSNQDKTEIEQKQIQIVDSLKKLRLDTIKVFGNRSERDRKKDRFFRR